MALPITPKPAYPNVPPAPGVPALPRQSGIARFQNTAVLLVADAASIIKLFTGPKWGFFTASGTPAFASRGGPGILGVIASVISALGPGGQSVGGVEFRQDYRVTTAPQTEGAFLSYNKVSVPFQARVTYIVGGLEGARTAFLQAVKFAQKSLNLYSLVMPEYTYPSCTIVHSDFRRTAEKGVSMFLVDIWAEEVRITGTAAFSTAQTPAGAPTTHAGEVTAQPVPSLGATPPPT